LTDQHVTDSRTTSAGTTAGVSQVESLPRAEPVPGRQSSRVDAPPRRRPIRDNSRLLLTGIGLLVVALLGLLALASRSTSYSPDFLTEVVLYALSVADLTMLAALVFVLARNIVKLLVERRRALPFARFRAKLVAVLLGMTLIPSVLVLIVGSEVIRTSADRWFNAPMDEVLSSASRIASDYYRDRQKAVADHAERIARQLAGIDLVAAAPGAVRDVIAPEVTLQRLQMVAVYRVAPGAGATPQVLPVIDVASPTLPPGWSRASADRLAARVAGGSADTRSLEPLPGGGELVRSAALLRNRDRRVVGVVVATDLLAGDLADRAHRITEAYQAYLQLRVLKQPLTGAYLSFFLMLTLMIMVGATWMGLYLAKRITRPVQLLSAAAREIGAGHLDRRLEPETADEFGSLVEAFNSMTSELAASRRKLERSTADLERKNLEMDERRRYIETVLERIATGVISVDADGRLTTVNAAAARLLGLSPDATGQAVDRVLARPEVQPLGAMLEQVARTRVEAPPQEIAVLADGREMHLAAVASALHGEAGAPVGAVLVFDDVTPLIRSQKVAAWREVARRLAHEIKNPLTPIQLSAERLRRHFAGAPPQTHALVTECTSTIVAEVESLKGLVDEFSQFARMPAPRAEPTALHALLDDTLALYDGLFGQIAFERSYDPAVRLVRLDPDQMRRVVVNLIDNAIEAMERRGVIALVTQLDVPNALVRVIIADNGPGIPPAERDKLFMPYYSTKRRGSGLGLAIVRRIVAEHRGSIEVGDNVPKGTRITIELPA
jgi:two-component system nitrogen regulation sensor histidine kinase NtrY